MSRIRPLDGPLIYGAETCRVSPAKIYHISMLIDFAEVPSVQWRCSLAVAWELVCE